MEGQVLWPEPSVAGEQCVRQIVNLSVDPYVRLRGEALLKNSTSRKRGYVFGLALQSAPSGNKQIEQCIGKLVVAWPQLAEVYQCGMPGKILWPVFKQVADMARASNLCMSMRAADLTDLFFKFTSQSKSLRKEHDQMAYQFIPFDPIRHAYDFFTVVWPVCEGDVFAVSFKKCLRALRAVWLASDLVNCMSNWELFETNVTQRLAEHFKDSNFFLFQDKAYRAKMGDMASMERLFMSAKMDVKIPNELVTSTKTVPAALLLEVAQLLQLIGAGKAYFLFDLICGFSIPPCMRAHGKHEKHRWYGVTRGVVETLLSRMQNSNIFSAPDCCKEDLVWLDAKEDARRMVKSWPGWMARGAPQLSGNIDMGFAVENAQEGVKVHVVEHEPGYNGEDFLLVPVLLSDDYLEDLAKNLGALYLHEHPRDIVNKENITGSLSCLMPLSNDFVYGVEKVVKSIIQHPDLHTSDISIEALQDMHEKLCEKDRESWFVLALRSSAFFYLHEHHFKAVCRLSSFELSDDNNELDNNNNSELDRCEFESLVDEYDQLTAAAFGAVKLNRLKKIEHFRNTLLPRAYKLDRLLISDLELLQLELEECAE